MWAPAGSGAARPGQVVSRENRCRAGRSGCTGAPTGEPLWIERRRCWPTRGDRRRPVEPPTPTPRGRLLAAIAEGLGLPPIAGAAGLRGRAQPAGRRRCGMPAGEPVAATTTWRTTPATRRAALLARLDESVTEPAAYVLPLHRRDDELRLGQRRLAAAPRPHRAARRAIRRPGCGCRWTRSAGTAAAVVRRRPAGRRGALPAAGGRRRRPRAVAVEDAEAAPTTALVVEIRDGLLYVFLPPTEELEHFVDLVARRRGRGRQGRLPGGDRGLRPAAGPAAAVDDRHARPRRHRGQRRSRPPVSPSSVDSSRPCTSRPGRPGWPPRRSTSTAAHGGTGGGNHITLGGVTPGGLAAAAPARPAGLAADLLAAPPVAVLPVLRPVHRHHIQAPRVDEGRAETLYELEIAFAEIAPARPAGGSAASRG